MRACTVWLVSAMAVASLSNVRSETWWDSTVVYQIYPRSFKDSDGDGIGDLNGIKSKLDYLKDTGVDAIWLSPLYPMYDFGFDIADYRAIATEYGTMADFENLLTTAKSLVIRVILDFVPNHTSLESEWFKESAKKNATTFKDYYIWADGKKDENDTNGPPSNWISTFGGSAWQWHEDREQYYLHQFMMQQPDVNYRCPALREEMKNVLRFWLDKGVSGFRVDAVNMLYEADPALHGGLYPDEPLSDTTNDIEAYGYLNHIYTKDQNETYDVVYDWRDVLDEYIPLQNESKLMMTEAYTDTDLVMRYYGNGNRTGSMPFNFAFLGELSGTSTANKMKQVIDNWMNNMPSGKTANWVTGNHDQSRMATRHGVDRVDAMNMLALLLPGVTITYQGEELGMTDGSNGTIDAQACQPKDSKYYWQHSCDPARTPFHWDNTKSAGFSTNATTWLPVASNYETVNVAVQQADTKSHYKFYKDMISLKHTSPVKSGDLYTTALSDTVLVVTRSLDNDTVVGIMNLSPDSQTLNLSAVSSVPQDMQVSASGVACSLDKGVEVAKTAIILAGNCALALETKSAAATTTSTETTNASTETTNASTETTNASTAATNASTDATNATSETTSPSTVTTKAPTVTTTQPDSSTKPNNAFKITPSILLVFAIRYILNACVQ